MLKVFALITAALFMLCVVLWLMVRSRDVALTDLKADYGKLQRQCSAIQTTASDLACLREARQKNFNDILDLLLRFQKDFSNADSFKIKLHPKQSGNMTMLRLPGGGYCTIMFTGNAQGFVSFCHGDTRVDVDLGQTLSVSKSDELRALAEAARATSDASSLN